MESMNTDTFKQFVKTLHHNVPYNLKSVLPLPTQSSTMNNNYFINLDSLVLLAKNITPEKKEKEFFNEALQSNLPSNITQVIQGFLNVEEDELAEDTATNILGLLERSRDAEELISRERQNILQNLENCKHMLVACDNKMEKLIETRTYAKKTNNYLPLAATCNMRIAMTPLMEANSDLFEMTLPTTLPKFKEGDICRVIKGTNGLASVNIGKIVYIESIHKTQHPIYGIIYRCVSKKKDLTRFNSDDSLTENTNWADLPAKWLELVTNVTTFTKETSADKKITILKKVKPNAKTNPTRKSV